MAGHIERREVIRAQYHVSGVATTWLTPDLRRTGIRLRVIIGRTMPVTPRVGIAVATIIMSVIVSNSPRVSAQLARHNPRSRCTVTIVTNSKKKAAGVEEEKPIGVPLSSMVV